MGGIPPTITQDAEFSEYMFSLLMNDFKAVEDYKTTDDMPLISCDISLFSSESDISYDNMMQWNQYSSMSCSYYEFEGSHFFINEYVFETVSTINHILRF
ncbi:Phenyloxazoline synthase MbtB [compost metagenome]